MTPIQTFDALLPHGVTLACRRCGPPGAPRVLLLHGFPEAAFVWDEVMQRLAAQADCTAPNLRGYAGSSAPVEVEAYRARALIGDLAALIELLGGPIDLLVAHDWGGALAWGLAAQRPELLKKLLVINAPHPATFLRELRDNPLQQQASAYMSFLCRPDAAALLAANDFARMWPFFTNMGGEAWLDEATREAYRAVWRQGLEGPLNYYRASPLRPGETVRTLTLPADLVTVRVPTTVLWADADSALPPALLDGLGEFVPTLDIQRVPGATHWIVHEQPALVAATIERLLAQ
jgi:pimeloyl-ACP methyl ester carboxylesterase